jgi:6,7-dimethyl-8-ribityllumazine synthase
MAQPRKAAGTRKKGAAKGAPALDDARVLIVEARFYDDIADMLLKGATRALKDAGVAFDRISVPGALEIPCGIVIALEAADDAGKPYHGVVALGCVIRGETSHYDIVAGESARGLVDISLARGLPIGNGILTVDTEAQAVARARPDKWNKGGGAAQAALALMRIRRAFRVR